MAKITRKTQKIFGESAGATGITEYGSPASGTPAYSTDLDDIQTTAWGTGWSAAALAGTEIPTFQDFNAIHYTATTQLAYLFQEGIPEYDVATEYNQFSIVKKVGTYELYGSKINANTGNALPSQTDNTEWKYLGDLSQSVTDPTISDYSSSTEYDQFSIVRKVGTYEIYGSKISSNTGNALPNQTDNTEWQYLGDLADLASPPAPAQPVPIGTMLPYAGTSLPTGFLACDGSAVSRTTYAALFAAIGTTWGAGNGSTTFNTPNLVTNNRFLRAAGGSLSVGGTQTDLLASHSHTGDVASVSGSITGVTNLGADNSYLQAGSINATGGAETRPHNAAALFIIKYQ